MKKISRDTLIDWALLAGIVLSVCLALFLVIHYLLPGSGGVLASLILMLAPFLIAWLVSILTKPVVDFFNQKLHIPRALTVLLVMLILAFLIVGVLALIISRIVVEIAGKTKALDMQGLIDNVFIYVQDLLLKLDFHMEDLAVLRDWLIGQSEKIVSFLSSAAGGAISVIQSTPTILLFIIVTLVAIYFWCKDADKIENALVSLAPKSAQHRFRRVYDTLSNVVGEYCRAQFILIAISMLICIVAFSIMGIKGAFTYGILTGVLDILPVVGPGTIIIPCGIILLISGNRTLGIGMFVLYVVLIVVRNIIEPKLVGDRLGLHPLATLASIFIGYRLFGFWGLVIGPILVAMGFAIWRSMGSVKE